MRTKKKRKSIPFISQFVFCMHVQLSISSLWFVTGPC